MSRPRLWWRLVIASTLLYALMLVSNYFLLWLSAGGRAVWIIAEVLLVGLAVFAAVRDIAAAYAYRPMRGGARVAMVLAFVVLLLWLAGLLLLPALDDGRITTLRVLIGILVALPIVPMAALALPGTILFKRSAAV